MPVHQTLSAAVGLALAVSAGAQSLTHRWSFDQTGPASNGTVIDDRISAAPAVVRGTGATLDRSALTLPGGTNGRQPALSIAAYVDLPNGIISSKTDFTLEIWATINQSRAWQRLFDFGSMNIAGDGLGEEGEITGDDRFRPGGTQSRDHLMLAVQLGGNLNQQRLSGTTDGSAEIASDVSVATTLATRYHFVVKYESGVGDSAETGGRFSWFRNGSQVGSADLDFRLHELDDVNNWLGRSQWTNDQNASISYEEVRLYDYALDQIEINANGPAGPDADIPASAAPDSATLLHGGQVALDVLANDSGELVGTSLEIEQPPASGTAEITADGRILYTHTSGTPAQDSFIYRVANSSGQFDSATVTLDFSATLKFANDHLNVPSDPPATTLSLVDAFGGLSFIEPVCLSSPPGDTSRLFVCQKRGLLRVIPDVTAENPTASTFLNLSSLLSSRGEIMDTGGESGLLGLAFHPDYSENRYLYIFYSVFDNVQRFQRVSRFTTQAGNPNAADPDSELILIDQFDDANNHNGGDLHFGPDGYLYISVGDEGNANDTLNNSQTITKDLFAGILRIDVDKLPGNVAPTPHPAIPTDSGEARFSIPIDNPFVHTSLGGTWDGTYNGSAVSQPAVRREFYATGLRNPWRMSFDPATGELWCADVGQGAFEEVNIIENGGNYGWAYREGFQNGPKSGQAPAGFDRLYHARPIHAYGRSEGISITGGLVYRGNRISSLYGKYIFADYGSGNIWSLERPTGSAPVVERIAGTGGIVGFGTDPSNQDLLLADINNNRILRLVVETNKTTFPATLTATGLFADVKTLAPSPGLTPYTVNLPFWSDHALKTRWFIVPDGTSSFTTATDEPWTLPSGTIWVKHFDIETERGNPATGKRLETRLIVKNGDGIYGVSYHWNDEGTEATLVPDEGVGFDLEIIEGGTPVTQTWRIPSRAECLTCHTPQGGHALSFNTRQLNLYHDMLGFTGNQLDTLADHGFLANDPGEPNLLPRHLRPDETEFATEARVRSYIDVNCAYCHQQDGTAGGSAWDGRSELTLAETGLLLGDVANDNGDPENKLVVPGDATHSVMLSRIAGTHGFSRMPPIATNELDQDAIDLLTEWITAKLPARQTYAEWREDLFGSDPDGNPAADPDGDGADNLQEFTEGTDPLDPSDRLRPQLAAGDGVTLNFPLPENRSFQVMFSDDLQSWTPWDVPGNQGLPVAGGVIDISGPMTAPRRFFTIEVSDN